MIGSCLCMNNVQKESIDDVQELKIKMENTMQYVPRLKDDYEVRNIKYVDALLGHAQFTISNCLEETVS